MDSDRIDGKGKQVGGRLRDWWGKVTGRPEDRIAGKIEHGIGRVQEGFGRLKDEVRAEEKRQEERPPNGPGRV